MAIAPDILGLRRMGRSVLLRKSTVRARGGPPHINFKGAFMSKIGGSKSYHTSLCKKENYAAQLLQFMSIMKSNKLTLEDLIAETPWLKEYLSAYRNLESIWQTKTDKGFKSISYLGYSNSVIYRMREDVTVEFMSRGGKPAPTTSDHSQNILKIDPDKILTLPFTNGELKYDCGTYSWHYVTDLLVNYPGKFVTFIGYNYMPDPTRPDQVFSTTQAFCGVNKATNRVTTIDYKDWAGALLPISASFLMREKVCKKQPTQGKLDLK